MPWSVAVAFLPAAARNSLGGAATAHVEVEIAKASLRQQQQRQDAAAHHDLNTHMHTRNKAEQRLTPPVRKLSAVSSCLLSSVRGACVVHCGQMRC